MFRRPGTGPSKASATTLCQKCLKRGHYSYECKASAQERPYKSRPSRTQQLLNPQLKPKLTTEVPNELLRKKGVADDILKKKDEERGRTTGRKRSRSRSRSSSADSVSTISTNRSPSRSPPPRRQKHDAGGKRSRRSVSMDSRSSTTSRHSGDRGRNTRRRVSSFSPEQRGRRREGDRKESIRKSRERSRSKGRHSKRALRRLSTSRSRSRSADHMDTADDRPKRIVSRSQSRSGSARPPRGDRNPSPYLNRRAARRSPSPQRERNGGRVREEPQTGGRNRFDKEPTDTNGRSGPAPPVARQPPPAPRERSLSPFSKRVALTRAMNAG